MSSSMRLFLTVVLLSACEPVKAPADDDAATGSIDASTEPDAQVAAENCFDGLDDDESGAADCADPTCGGEAICVPVPDTGQPGIVIEASESCPPGFTGGETVLFRGPQQDACEGCSCTPGTTTCSTQLFWYPSDTACAADTGLTGGTGVPVTTLEPSCPNPFTSGFIYGGRAVITPTSQTCTKAGTAAPPAPRWAETRKFCRASTVGAGCAAGSACVPRREAPSQCALAAEGAACTGFASSDSDWATSYSDTRVCGACGCTAAGGSCGDVKVEVGSDYTCGSSNGVTLTNGQKACDQIYSPPVRRVGAPTPPSSCSVAAPQTGALEGRSLQTLCCGT